jgi:hypothetical protein
VRQPISTYRDDGDVANERPAADQTKLGRGAAKNGGVNEAAATEDTEAPAPRTRRRKAATAADAPAAPAAPRATRGRPKRRPAGEEAESDENVLPLTD